MTRHPAFPSGSMATLLAALLVPLILGLSHPVANALPAPVASLAATGDSASLV